MDMDLTTRTSVQGDWTIDLLLRSDTMDVCQLEISTSQTFLTLTNDEFIENYLDSKCCIDILIMEVLR
jgi:hypothetical protein